MGIAQGRFVIDAHVHNQRHALNWKGRGVQPDYVSLAKFRAESEPYDNSPRLLYDMERYNVDMCVIMAQSGATDELTAATVKKYPDKFVAKCSGTDYRKRVSRGETEWSIEDLCKELDQLLTTGLFRAGIGEGMPGNPKRDLNKPVDWAQRFEEICRIMEVAKKHGTTVGWHTGGSSGYAGARGQLASRSLGEGGNPLLAHDVAAAYPDVPLILTHAGVDGWWGERTWELCLEVAAAHPNVYLETGQWWPELYEKPLRDPNIGVERLLWATDWGAAHPVQWWPGSYPSTYFDQSRKEGIPAHIPDIFGHSLRWLDRLDIPQDDLNLILGGNAVRLYKLEDKVPYTRFFKQFLR